MAYMRSNLLVPLNIPLIVAEIAVRNDSSYESCAEAFNKIEVVLELKFGYDMMAFYNYIIHDWMREKGNKILCIDKYLMVGEKAETRVIRIQYLAKEVHKQIVLRHYSYHALRSFNMNLIERVIKTRNDVHFVGSDIIKKSISYTDGIAGKEEQQNFVMLSERMWYSNITAFINKANSLINRAITYNKGASNLEIFADIDITLLENAFFKILQFSANKIDRKKIAMHLLLQSSLE